MLVNADFSRRAIVSVDEYRWVHSPQSGVERVMLDRMGAERGHATSIVRYAPASTFPLHHHPGGEEVFVLSGVFSEGERDYPAGWYLRNPPGSFHRPGSIPGAIIFVKLWQIPSWDNAVVRIDTRDAATWRDDERGQICPLFSSDDEHVCLQRLDSGAVLFDATVNGVEVLVLSGDMKMAGRSYRRGSWLRFPVGEYPGMVAGRAGATLYVKTGHLAGLASGAAA